MENTNKLYNFLILDNNVLEDEEFIEYNGKRIYTKLLNKYKVSLAVLSYLKVYAQKEIEELKKGKGADTEDIQNKINNIIEECGIDRVYINLYAKSKMENAMEVDIKTAEVMMDTLPTDKKRAIEQIYSYYLDIYENEYCVDISSFYERFIRNVDRLEKIFLKTYAFFDMYDGQEWCAVESKIFLNSLEGLAVILMQQENEENTDEGEDSFCIEEYRKYLKDDIEYDAIGYEKNVDREILFSFSVVEALLGIYEKYDLLSGKREKTKYRKNIQIGYEDKEQIKQLLEFLDIQIAKTNQGYKDNEEKKDNNLIQDAFIHMIKSYKLSRELELEYMEKFISADIDFMRYQKMVAKLEESVRIYDSYRNAKYVKLNSKEERDKDKERRLINEQKRNKVFEDIVKIYKAISENKRNALNKVVARLNKKIRLDSMAHSELINVDLYKSIFNMLRKDIKDIENNFKNVKDVEESENSINDNSNQFYIFNDIAIMTLTFPNTKIGKYKTAAIIIDKKDIKKIFLNSGKRCWTFKNGLECTHYQYEKKTMKPDKITANAGKLVLLNVLMGVKTEKISLIENHDDGKKKEYYTTSHKFDLRTEKIVENIDKSKAIHEKMYYSGKIRIEDEGELDATNTVCFNNENNNKDASILYFDNADKFKEFLRKI